MSDEKVPPQSPSDDTPAAEPSPGTGSTPPSDPGTPPPPAGAGSPTGAGGSGGSAPPPPSSGGGGAGSTGAGAPPPPPSGGGTGGTAPPPPSSGPSGPGGPGNENRGLMLVLSYLWVLALIPYLMEQEDPEVKWHARHGIVLMVAEILLGVVMFVLSLIPGVGCLFSILWMLVTIAIIVLHVFLIMKAVNGERYTIPQISHYADQIP